jgi:hypothetical protein
VVSIVLRADIKSKLCKIEQGGDHMGTQKTSIEFVQKMSWSLSIIPRQCKGTLEQTMATLLACTHVSDRTASRIFDPLHTSYVSGELAQR